MMTPAQWAEILNRNAERGFSGLNALVEDRGLERRRQALEAERQAQDKTRWQRDQDARIAAEGRAAAAAREQAEWNEQRRQEFLAEQQARAAKYISENMPGDNELLDMALAAAAADLNFPEDDRDVLKKFKDAPDMAFKNLSPAGRGIVQPLFQATKTAKQAELFSHYTQFGENSIAPVVKKAPPATPEQIQEAKDLADKAGSNKEAAEVFRAGLSPEQQAAFDARRKEISNPSAAADRAASTIEPLPFDQARVGDPVPGGVRQRTIGDRFDSMSGMAVHGLESGFKGVANAGRNLMGAATGAFTGVRPPAKSWKVPDTRWSDSLVGRGTESNINARALEAQELEKINAVLQGVSQVPGGLTEERKEWLRRRAERLSGTLSGGW